MFLRLPRGRYLGLVFACQLLFLPACQSGMSHTFKVSSQPEIFLTSERVKKLSTKIAHGDEGWRYFSKRANKSLGRVPKPGSYGAGELSSAFALIYRMTGDRRYLKQAKTYFFAYYLDEQHPWDFKNRNTFRRNNRWAHFTFNWLRDDWSPEEKQRIVSVFNTWANHALEHTGKPNRSAQGTFRIEDSDEVTSLAENVLLLGLSLKGETDLSVNLLERADELFNTIVVATYMQDWMRGGLWGEGTQYSGATMQHWMRQMLINRELRGISLPNKYHEEALLATLHSTFPDFNSVFVYGDVEGVEHTGDYRLPASSGRYDMMLHLIALQQKPELKSLGQHWLSSVMNGQRGKAASSYTGIWRFLFEEDDSTLAESPASLNLPTWYRADGLGFVASRSSWKNDASVVYFQNGRHRVDHAHDDALSFNIIRGPVVVTKEMSGYQYSVGSAARSSTAHNTLLIQNESADGSSGPLGRAGGDGVNRVAASTRDYTYIEADATPIYNRGKGYQPDIYADHVVRKLLFLKPDIVLVYDSIGILPQAGPRWTKYIQHFQVKPVEAPDGSYSGTSEGVQFSLKTLLPVDAKTELVDQSVLWQQSSKVEAPPNQRRWHLSISPPQTAENVRYLNYLHFDVAGSVVPQATLINVRSKMPVTGVSVDSNGQTTFILMNDNPKGQRLDAAIEYPMAQSVASKHYVFGLNENSSYDVSAIDDSQERKVRIIPDGRFTASKDGILEFSMTAEGRVGETTEIK